MKMVVKKLSWFFEKFCGIIWYEWQKKTVVGPIRSLGWLMGTGPAPVKYESEFFLVHIFLAPLTLRILQTRLPPLLGGVVPKAIRLLCPLMCIYTLYYWADCKLSWMIQSERRRMGCATAPAGSFANCHYKDVWRLFINMVFGNKL